MVDQISGTIAQIGLEPEFRVHVLSTRPFVVVEGSLVRWFREDSHIEPRYSFTVDAIELWMQKSDQAGGVQGANGFKRANLGKYRLERCPKCHIKVDWHLCLYGVDGSCSSESSCQEHTVCMVINALLSSYCLVRAGKPFRFSAPARRGGFPCRGCHCSFLGCP